MTESGPGEVDQPEHRRDVQLDHHARRDQQGLEPGAALACAAGNDGWSTVVYPAGYSNCIAVAATDAADQRASFSNYGTWVDVAAPGVGILSSVTSGGYESWNGTSMATPHVAGALGLVWSTALCTTNSCVRGRVESYADRIGGTGTYWAKGRLNACRAVGASSC